MSNKFKKIICGLLVGGLFTVTGFAENEVVPVTPSATPDSNLVEIPVPASTTVPDTTPYTNPKNGRLWNLQDADILSVINEVSQETGKTFVVDPRVSGKISLISSKPLRQKEVYQVFLSVLGMLGYSAIPSGSVIKIVPNMEAGEQATAVTKVYAADKGEEVVVRVIPLENVSSTQLIPILRPLMPQWSNISAYAPGNVLILLGRAGNLERIINIIQDVDHASSTGIQIIPLHYASAIQIAAVLNNLQNAARAAGESPGVSIAVDERSNSILLGGPKAMRLRLRVLISQLDARTTTPAGNTEVIYLRYLQAKTLAPLLTKIAQNILGRESSGSRYDMGVMGPPMPGMNGPPGNGGPKEGAGNQGLIQAEPNSNALIITAQPALMGALKAVIAKLDIRPAEVHVEAVIAEIDESNLLSLGIQWGSVFRNGKFNPFPTGDSPTSFPALGAGVIGIIPGADIRAVLSLLENLNGVDILSTPSIVVLDNQKATIEVGQDVPYRTGEYTTPTATDNARTLQPFNTITAKPVTLKLDVTPQINLGSSVRMKIDLKNDSLQNPSSNTLTPVIKTSKIKNSVIIKSGDILVLGGLISKTNNENINKVPILGDIPVVGMLFTQRTRTVEKKNLMVFIKPMIMYNNEDATAITYVKYNEIRNTQANFREDLAEIGKSPAPTLLPPWKNTKDLPKPFESVRQCPPAGC